jgi:hypothetical protein
MRFLAGHPIKGSKGIGPLTAVAQLVGIGIATSPHDLRPKMEQLVIGAVGANHQVRRRIIPAVSVHMMHFRRAAKVMPEGLFSNENVDLHLAPRSHGARMVMMTSGHAIGKLLPHAASTDNASGVTMP